MPYDNYKCRENSSESLQLNINCFYFCKNRIKKASLNQTLNLREEIKYNTKTYFKMCKYLP